MLRIALATIILFLALWVQTGLVGADLPALFGAQGRENTEKAYRLRAQVSVTDKMSTTLKIFQLEEWASSSKRAFRLDATELNSGARKSLLINHETGEMFSFEPFTCELINTVDDWWDPLLKEFMFVEPADPLVPTGLGAIWIKAATMPSTYKEGVIFDRATNQNSVATRQYTISMPLTKKSNPHLHQSAQYGFIFGIRQSAENVVGAQTKLLNFHIDAPSVLIAARLDDIEIGSRAFWDLRSDLFELPAGYGCTRSAEFEHSFKVPYDLMGYRTLPHSLDMEIISSRPEEKQPDRWRTKTSWARLQAGRLVNGRDYVVIRTDHHEWIEEAINGSESSRRPVLERRKWVWDLGPGALGPFADEADAAAFESVATFFELDMRSGECAGWGQVAAHEGAYLRPDAPGNLFGLELGWSLIDSLLYSSSDFHFINENNLFLNQNRHLACHRYTYERRLDRLEQIAGTQGAKLWPGPVSVVRQQTICDDGRGVAPEADGGSQTSSPLDRDLEPLVSIHLLDDSRRTLMGLVEVRITNRRHLSEAALHSQLDVSSCLAAQHSDPMRASEGISFGLSYTIESHQLLEALQLDWGQVHDIAYQSFLERLMELSRDRRSLDLLQLVGVSVELDGSDETGPALLVRGRLLDKPAALEFVKTPSSILSTDAQVDSSRVRVSLATSAAICGDRCQHQHDCQVFAFCQQQNLCHLYLGDSNSASNNANSTDNKLKLIKSTDCDLYSARHPKWRRIGARQLALEMRHQLSGQLSRPDKWPTMALEIVHHDSDGRRSKVDLLPARVQLKLGHQFEWEDDNNNNNNNINNIDSDDPTYGAQDTLEWLKQEARFQANYELVFPNRKFVNSLAGLQTTKRQSLDQCQQLCDEFDCRSFAYCRVEKSCQLSSELHSKTELEPNLIDSLSCNVLSRDYLSKFERLEKAGRWKASLGSGGTSETGNEKTPALGGHKVTSERDCATLCMDTPDHQCRAFSFCPTSRNENCFLHERASSVANTALGHAHHWSPLDHAQKSNETQICHLFVRSYLADFERFQSRSLPVKLNELFGASSGNQEQATIRVSLARSSSISGHAHHQRADLCAAECLPGWCLAFHVCHYEDEPTSGAEESRSLESHFGADSLELDLERRRLRSGCLLMLMTSSTTTNMDHDQSDEYSGRPSLDLEALDSFRRQSSKTAAKLAGQLERDERCVGFIRMSGLARPEVTGADELEEPRDGKGENSADSFDQVAARLAAAKANGRISPLGWFGLVLGAILTGSGAGYAVTWLTKRRPRW